MSNPFGYLRRSTQQRFGCRVCAAPREVEEIDVINHDGLYVTLLVGKARGVWCGAVVIVTISGPLRGTVQRVCNGVGMKSDGMQSCTCWANWSATLMV